MKSDTYKSRILELRRSGLTIETIALELEISVSTVRKALAGNDPKPKRQTKLERALELYAQGMTYEEIAGDVGWQTKTVRQKMSEYSPVFTRLGKFGHHRPEMTKEEMRQRRHLMGTFLEQRGIGCYVTVLRGHQYKLIPERGCDIKRLLEIFSRSEVVGIHRKYIVIKKEVLDGT